MGRGALRFCRISGGAQATEDDLIAHARAHLAGFKRPKHIIFGALPKTSTGKILKTELRQRFQSR
jgi:fatty-acyl-CoA synthase